jgi:hypothetical protein
VRAESLYFYPVFACQIMNEGWASYWHARLLREAEFLPQPLYLAAIKAHSDVVRPYAAGQQTALAINPYHLGFTLWEHIVDKHGMEHARGVMRDEDDFGFIRNFLDRDLAESSTSLCTRRARATRSAWRTGISPPSVRRSSRPSSTTAHRAWRWPRRRPTAVWCSPTTTGATAGASTWRAPSACWSTRGACGAGRCASQTVNERGEPAELAA